MSVSVGDTFPPVLDDNTTYTLTQDIAISAPPTFSGDGSGVVVDGAWHTITIGAGILWLGMFSKAVSVKRLGIIGDNAELNSYGSGWFFKQGVGGTATNCYASGALTESTGGIFGVQSPGTAINCYFNGSASYPFIGTIFGPNSTGSAINCYSKSSYLARPPGLFGIDSTGSATNCYIVGGVGIFDAKRPNVGVETNCLSEVSWSDVSAKSVLNTYDSDGNRIWYYNNGDNVPWTLQPTDSSICFLSVAPVLTPSGYRAIGTLEKGDHIVTPSGDTVEIKVIKIQEMEPNAFNMPYIIPQGKFGATQRLLISPHHLVRDVNMEARFIGLERQVMTGPWKYYNLELANHGADMIVAGVAVESWKPWDGVERKP